MTIELSDETVAVIVKQVTERVLATIGTTGSPWMTRAEAAEYLRLPLSRLEKDRNIPSHRDGGRVLYNRRELDEYFLALGPCGS